MQKEILVKLLVLLFDSKLKIYTERMLDSWYELLKAYDINKLEKVIKQLIYTKEDFISIGLIHEMITPPLDTKQAAFEQWKEIHKRCCGNSGNVEKLADEIFRKISSYTEYGDLTDDYRKNSIRKDFLNVYENELKKNKPVMVENETKVIETKTEYKSCFND